MMALLLSKKSSEKGLYTKYVKPYKLVPKVTVEKGLQSYHSYNQD